MSCSRRFVAVMSVMAVVSSPSHADILFVDNCTRPGGGTDGISFSSIQAAIDAAVDGDEVVVAPCAYFETINFLGKAIRLRSSGGPDVTTIDAQGEGVVVTCTSGEGPDTILDGFTITGGAFFGGMRNEGSSPTVTDCSFDGNTAAAGGGMFTSGTSSPTVTNCSFTGNMAAPFSGLGGGMTIGGGSNVTVTGCTFTGNTTGLFGGGLVILNGSNATVTDCTFTDNVSVNSGGGMAILDGSPLVTGCTFIGNTALQGGGIMNGTGSSPILTNCVLHGNTASEGGGGMANFGSCPTLINCTITQNFDGPVGGGGIFNDGFNSSVTLVVLNCVLWDNFENQIREVGENSDTTVLYSNIQGGWPGLGNINALPMFVDPDNGDLRLQPGSPCIDAGDDTAVPKGVLRDLDGHPRFVDDACSGHAGPIVDIGAYEFQGTSCDLSNVMAIVAAWGSCTDCGTPQACPADFDGDCSVGGLDLLWLLRELAPERIVPINGNFRWGRPPRASQ